MLGNDCRKCVYETLAEIYAGKRIDFTLNLSRDRLSDISISQVELDFVKSVTESVRARSGCTGPQVEELDPEENPGEFAIECGTGVRGEFFDELFRLATDGKDSLPMMVVDESKSININGLL